MSRNAAEAVAFRANRLTDGAVVWFTARGEWSLWISDAAVALDAEQAAAAEARARHSEVGNVVVGVERAPVLPGATPQPIINKDAMRARGPSVRPDLGPQATLAPQADLAADDLRRAA